MGNVARHSRLNQTWKFAPANLLFLLAFILSGCCMDGTGACKYSDALPSSYTTSGLRDGSTIGGNPAMFTAATDVFRRNCVSCHAAYVNYTEAQWISIGDVVPGSPSTSTLYKRTRGSGSGANENMPPSGNVSAADLEAIRAWIAQLTVTNTGGGGGSSGGGGGGGTTTPPVDTAGAAARLTAALGVLGTTNGGNSCLSCHSTTRLATAGAYNGQTVPAFGAFTTDAQFVNSGLITPGVAVSNSWLYRALRGHGDIGTMPKTPASTMSNADAQILEDWILGM